MRDIGAGLLPLIYRGTEFFFSICIEYTNKFSNMQVFGIFLPKHKMTGRSAIGQMWTPRGVCLANGSGQRSVKRWQDFLERKQLECCVSSWLPRAVALVVAENDDRVSDGAGKKIAIWRASPGKSRRNAAPVLEFRFSIAKVFLQSEKTDQQWNPESKSACCARMRLK